jgi:hypothetical protein
MSQHHPDLFLECIFFSAVATFAVNGLIYWLSTVANRKEKAKIIPFSEEINEKLKIDL